MSKTREHWNTFICIPMDWAVEPPPPCALQVWAVLWDHRGKDGQCWPSQERIRACTQKTPGDPSTGLSVRGVRRGLRWLEGRRAGDEVGPRLIVSLAGKSGRTSTYALLWTTNTAIDRYAAAYSAQHPDKSDRMPGQERPLIPDESVRQTKNKRTKNYNTRGACAPVCEEIKINGYSDQDKESALPAAGLFQTVVRAWAEAGATHERTALGPMAITKGLEVLADAGIAMKKRTSVAGIVKTWVESLGSIPDGVFVEAVKRYVANATDQWFPMPGEIMAFADPEPRR